MSIQDVDLQVRESSISGYTVSLLSGGQRLAEVFLRHTDEIRRLPGALEAALRGGDPNLFFDLARRLYDQVFQEPIANAFQEARSAGPVRLRIRPEPPEIARIPWEALNDGKEPLSLAQDISFSRLPLEAPGYKPAAAHRELSILVAAAEATGTSEIDAIEEALSVPSQQGYLRVTRLRAATLDSIRSTLEGGRFRGVAIVAPGPLGSDRATGYLRLVAEGGRVREHTVTEVAPLLYGHRGIRFLLLSSGFDHPDWKGESFESLIRLCFGMKISGALAIPLPMPRAAYVQFLRTFFEQAIAGEPIDAAAGESRRILRGEGGIEFAVPVLFAGDPFCLKVAATPSLGDAAAAPEPFAAPPAPEAAPASEPVPAPPTPEPMEVEGLGTDIPLELPPDEGTAFDEVMIEEEEELEEAVEQFAAEGDRPNEAAALDRMGLSQLRRGRTRKAILSFQRSLEILKEERSAQEALSVLAHLGKAFEKAGETERALETFKTELALAEQAGENRRVTMALARIGERRRADGEMDLAVAVWERAVRLWQGMGEDGRAADLLTRIGAAHQGEGAFGDAESAYQGSLEIHRQRNDRVGVATALNNLGNVSLRKGSRDEAASRYAEALEVFREIGSQEGVASVCHNLANIALRLGDYQRSFDLTGEALSIARDLRLRSLLTSAGRMLRKIRSKVGDDAFQKMEEAAGPPEGPS